MIERKQQEDPSYVAPPIMNTILKKIDAVAENSKAKKVLELIKEVDDKVIIFTEYRATQMFLQWFLKQNGISSVPFRGGFKRGKKRLDERAI